MVSMAAWLLTILVPLQVLIGDLHGLNTLEHQPAKIAAMEGLWETRRRRAVHDLRDARPGRRAQPPRDRNSQGRQL